MHLAALKTSVRNNAPDRHSMHSVTFSWFKCSNKPAAVGLGSTACTASALPLISKLTLFSGVPAIVLLSAIAAAVSTNALSPQCRARRRAGPHSFPAVATLQCHVEKYLHSIILKLVHIIYACIKVSCVVEIRCPCKVLLKLRLHGQGLSSCRLFDLL